jgi:hypothetical protein
MRITRILGKADVLVGIDVSESHPQYCSEWRKRERYPSVELGSDSLNLHNET